MSDTKTQLMELLRTGAPSAIITSEVVADRFKKLYSVVHGIKDKARAEAFYQAEQFHFLKLIKETEGLAACTRLSLYGIFLDSAIDGLSFDPKMKHLSIMPYNVNIGTRETPRWEKRASRDIQGPGELLLRQIQGQVKYADNPVLVYEGDEFKYGSRDGKVILDHVATIPRTSTNVIACYIKITRYDDTVDYKVLTRDEFENLRKQSKKPNGPAYTANYNGMFSTKTLKHAFKNFPKLRVGEFSRVASETDEQEGEELPANYGLNLADDPAFGAIDSPTDNSSAAVANNEPTITPHEVVDENEFAAKAPETSGNTIVHADENF